MAHKALTKGPRPPAMLSDSCVIYFSTQVKPNLALSSPSELIISTPPLASLAYIYHPESSIELVWSCYYFLVFLERD